MIATRAVCSDIPAHMALPGSYFNLCRSAVYMKMRRYKEALADADAAVDADGALRQQLGLSVLIYLHT